MSESRPFKMTISLDVLRHLGIGLYSNIPAVLSELVANASDADATQVDITLDAETPSIEIRDNGHGMSHDDINDKFLTVGYRRRLTCAQTPKGRDAMGRKGIGKLAAFSISDTIEVHTADGITASGFRMNTDAIEACAADPEKPDYFPDPVPSVVRSDSPGTLIRLTKLRKMLSWTGPHLRRRLARRFSVIGPSRDFHVSVDGTPITVADRDYFKDMEFIWHFGERQARMYTEYIVGEVVADFLDDDDSDDIVTSGRQRVQQEDARCVAVTKTVHAALRRIRDEWTEKRNERGVERAFTYPAVQRWYERMGPDKQRTARRLFGKIEALRIDDPGPKYELYRASMLAFEKMALKDMLSDLDDWETHRDFELLARLMSGVDEIEEAVFMIGVCASFCSYLLGKQRKLAESSSPSRSRSR